MLNMRDYRKACDRLRLGTETLEEMIEMTENQKKRVLGRPARAMLVAAALVAAMAVTAGAAELPAVQQFFAKVFVTVNTDGGALTLPGLAVEEREGRTILLLDGAEIDVTDDLNKAGEYLYQGEGYEVRVDSDGMAVLTAYGEDGEVVLSFSTQKGAGGDEVTYNVEVDPEVDIDKLGSYTVVGDETTGTISVTDEDGTTYHYDAKGGTLTPAE